MGNITKETAKKLCQKIDTLSFGFPKSWLGSDIKLIMTIFDEDSANTFLNMGRGFLTAKDYASSVNMDVEEAKKHLDSAAEKGLIFRRHGKEEYEYSTYPFVLGFLEFQAAKKHDKKFLINTSLYMITSKFGKRMSQTMPFYRTVPHNPELVDGSRILPYDNINEILDRHHRFAVAPCLCRIMYKMKPFNPCNHPIETCIECDDYADFFIETGIGREITKQEAYDIIASGAKDGRVINVTNSKDGENICSCCKCGCGMLYMKTKYPGPSGKKWNNYYAVWDKDKCVHCNQCADKCGFGYLKVKKNGTITIDVEHCLGCGICAMNCKVHALKLVRKEDEDIYEPPQKYEQAIEIWEKETKKDYFKGK